MSVTVVLPDVGGGEKNILLKTQMHFNAQFAASGKLLATPQASPDLLRKAVFVNEGAVH